MPNKITATAQLVCNTGSAASELQVTSQDFSYCNDKLIATEADKEGQTNIPSFGFCKITRNKCFPKPTQWEKTAKIDTINGYKVLTEASTCPCAIGGTITVKDNGHGSIAEVND